MAGNGNGDIFPAEDKSIVSFLLFFLFGIYIFVFIWKQKNILALASRQSLWAALDRISVKGKHS